MDTLRKSQFVHASLQATFQEIFDAKSQNVIELHAGLVEYTDPHETSNHGITFEKAFGLFLVEGQQLTVESISSTLVDGL